MRWFTSPPPEWFLDKSPRREEAVASGPKDEWEGTKEGRCSKTPLKRAVEEQEGDDMLSKREEREVVGLNIISIT